MSHPTRNELWAGVLVDELIRGGVREVVVAPGSRSTPLVMAAARRNELRLTVQIDERAAGFLALGVGKATGNAAAVITTSGTAVANLLPAVVEAAQAQVPLLLLTADRPPRLRGADANQAIDQERIFGRYPRFYHELWPAEVSDRTLRHLRSVACRALAAAVGTPAGPVHLNLPFEKPLEPAHPGPVSGQEQDEGFPGLSVDAPGRVGRSGGRPFTRIHGDPGMPHPAAVERLEGLLAEARRPLLVAGPLPRPWVAGPAMRRFAASRTIPVLADALSGARYPGFDDPAFTEEGEGPSPVVGSYDLSLQSLELRRELAPDLVIRMGQAPTSARLNQWLAELAEGGSRGGRTRQVVVDAGGRWKDHLAVADEVLTVEPAGLLAALAGAGPAISGGLPTQAPEAREAWVRRWRQVEAALRSHLSSVLPASELHEGAAVARLLRRLPSDDLLFVSSSMPVREVDAFAPHRDAPLQVLGNRGASGIDGITSTAAGVALGTGKRVAAVVGDLALLHDAQGLAVLRESGIRVILVVLNNDGGGIFHLLPIREHEPAFTPYFATPHGRDLSHLAALYDLPHRRVASREALEGGLDWALGLGGSGILEIHSDRESNRRLREAALEAAEEVARKALAHA